MVRNVLVFSSLINSDNVANETTNLDTNESIKMQELQTEIGTHALCILATFFTALFRSSRWWARRKMGRESEIWSSRRCTACSVDQISCKDGMDSLASHMIAWITLYSRLLRPSGNETYTCAANCPSTCGVDLTRPWWRAGLSTGVGTTTVEETGGSFFLWNPCYFCRWRRKKECYLFLGGGKLASELSFSPSLSSSDVE